MSTAAPQAVNAVHQKYGDWENEFIKATGYGFDQLTQSEARYLANFKPAITVRNRILEAGSKGRPSASDGNSGQRSGSPKLSRAQPSTSIAARASAAIEKPSGTAKPLDKLAQAVTRATGIERLTRAAYDSAGYLLERFTPEQIKAGVVSD